VRGKQRVCKRDCVCERECVFESVCVRLCESECASES
jgi:hypothetical protein